MKSRALHFSLRSHPSIVIQKNPIARYNWEMARRQKELCSCVYCTSSSSSITERKRFHVQIHFSSQKFSCACILTKQSL